MIERIQELATGAGVSAAGPGSLLVSLAGGSLPVTIWPARSGGAELTAVWSAPPAMASLDLGPLARVTALARTGLLRCEAQSGSVRIFAPLFADGLTQHAVLTAALEVGKTYEVLNVAAAEWEEQRAAAAEAARTLADIDAALTVPTSSPQPAPTARPAPTTQPARAPQAAPPAGQPAAGWRRTHVGPPDGLSAWATPDPATQSTWLPGGVELQLVEVRSGWGHVAAQNGWHGWVDLRALRPAV